MANVVDQYAGKVLRTTLPRVRAKTATESVPPVDALLGDHLAWLFDFEGVTDVVVGTVVGEEGLLLADSATFPFTRCTMNVEQRFKGAEGATLEFFTLGAKTNGLVASASHAPSCTLGDTALVFVADLGGRKFAVGSNEAYVVTHETREGQTRWAGQVISFVQELSRGAP